MAHRRFSTYLIAGFVILIIACTISAGVPAYWIMRNQLERQTWANVENARQATASLLQAEQNQLNDLITIFAERPTLRRLVQTGALAELPPFMAAFQAQSKVDLLLFCQTNGERVAGSTVLAQCPAVSAPQFMLIEGQPALVVSRAVQANQLDSQLGIATAALWLDQPFLQQMAANTGAEANIVTTTGQVLTSSIADGPQPALPALASTATAQAKLTLTGQPYYVVYLPLSQQAGPAPFGVGVALPVADLIVTERRALLILVTSTSLVALLGVVLATGYVRRLTQPLGALTRVAERMSSGDFVAPIPAFATPEEVATLSTALIKSQASMLRALDERSQARDWLNNLIQSIVEGVVTFDNKGYITFLSQGAETLTGWTLGEALGQPIDKLFPTTEEEGDSFLNRIPLPGGRRLIHVLNRSGKAVTLSVTGARLAPPNEKTVQVALVLRDVTNEEALRNLRSYFLANISHEFKTPLSTLNASLELLLDSGEEYSVDEVREVLKPAHLSLLSLQNLIDNLLQSSSIEAGHFVIRKRPVALYHVVEDALRLVQPLFDRRRQQFAMHDAHDFLDSVAAREIQADKGRLTQVLVNLLVNASKYSPIGGEIELTVTAQPPGLRVAIADRGPGIPPLERLNLFRRFVRLAAQDSEEYGTGLGLYVVKTTVEAHGGQVGIDDRLDGGSIFWFDLPLPEERRLTTDEWRSTIDC